MIVDLDRPADGGEKGAQVEAPTRCFAASI
jgi:hypothetical protein